MLSCSSPKRRLSWDFSPHRRKEKKHLLPSKCMTFLVPLGGKDRKGSSSPPLACERSTDYWCDGQEAVSGQTLFSAGTCTPAIIHPTLPRSAAGLPSLALSQTSWDWWTALQPPGVQGEELRRGRITVILLPGS